MTKPKATRSRNAKTGRFRLFPTYEHHHQPLLPHDDYMRRVFRSLSVAGLMLAFCLAVGIVGYHVWGHLAWLDSLVNASMILGGMGPVDPITTAGGKWFASAYAIFSGVAFLTSVSVFMAPIVHRFLHSFHLEADDAE